MLRADLGANFYATQTWSDIPSSDGRRIQIAWMSGGKYPNMSFNQQMSTPCELTLRTTPEGIRMYRQPVKEIDSLHKDKLSWTNQILKPGENPLSFLDRYAYLEPVQNMIQMQILVDRTSIEVFGNDGRVSMSSCFLPDPENTSLSIYSLGGEAEIVSMNIYEMCSIWL